MFRFSIISICSLVVLQGCASIPPLPDEQELPAREIIQSATCELAESFKNLQQNSPSFKADRWAALIKLYPKIDYNSAFTVGGNGKTSQKANYAELLLGAGAPGLGASSTGHHGAWMDYAVHTWDLIHNQNQSAACSQSSLITSSHPLASRIGIQNWLERSLLVSSKIVTPADFEFETELTIRFDASGGFTYFEPSFSIGPTAAIYRSTDVLLTITFTDDTKYATQVVSRKTKTVYVKKRVRPGLNDKNAVSPQSEVLVPKTVVTTTVKTIQPAPGISENARTRLELLQLQQTLGGLGVR